MNVTHFHSQVSKDAATTAFALPGPLYKLVQEIVDLLPRVLALVDTLLDEF
jgi:hypothetical protein